MKKKAVFALVLAGALVLLPGCVSTTTQARRDPNITTNLARKDYEVLGPVTMESDVTSILGIIYFGGKGYADLLAEAQRLYPEANALIDIYRDQKNVTILGVYNRFGMIYSATAIKVTDPVPYVN